MQELGSEAYPIGPRSTATNTERRTSQATVSARGGGCIDTRYSVSLTSLCAPGRGNPDDKRRDHWGGPEHEYRHGTCMRVVNAMARAHAHVSVMLQGSEVVPWQKMFKSAYSGDHRS